MVTRAYGYGDEPQEDGAVCPLCGGEGARAYYRLGEYIGCDLCVEERDDLPCPDRGDGKREGRYGEM